MKLGGSQILNSQIIIYPRIRRGTAEVVVWLLNVFTCECVCHLTNEFTN